MRICFIWYWNRASEISPNWRDGYTACVEELGKEHDIDVYMDEDLPDPAEPYDFIWLWADPNSPVLQEIQNRQGKKGVSLTTMPQNMQNLKGLDVIYCESQPVTDAVRAAGFHAVKAFGTDEQFFSPDDSVEKTIPYFYPATFSPWKRQSELAYLGPLLTCVGTVQPDGLAEKEACDLAAVNIEEGYFPAQKIRDMYRRTQRIIIPAVHGSERTVLEAMSMNIPVEVTHPDTNFKTASYLEEYKKSGCKSTREFILKEYSAAKFAENIMKGLK